MLQLTFLGQFDVVYDGERVSVPTRNAQALLAYLALTPGQAHRREKLAGLLWPDSAEESARSNLRHELWRLRKALEPTRQAYLLVDDLSIAFNSNSDYLLDTRQLDNTPIDTESTDELMAALSLYVGDLLPGLYNEWVLLERDRLRTVYESRLARLLGLLEAEGRWVELQDWASRWIATGEWPEPAWRALILSYAQTGDLPRAVATYERFSHQLQSELGLKPSEQTQALYQRIRSGWISAAPNILNPDPAPQRVVRPTSTNLPRPLTSFIGRQKDIEFVKGLIGESRLVTIVGPGGMGKTRLAIAVATEMTPRFRDGVWWVDLAPLAAGAATANDLVMQAIAKSVRVPDVSGGSVRIELAEYLRGRATLLILDNCEHLIAACADIAESLLSEFPELSILATSREPLRISGERVWALSSLVLPIPEDMLDSNRIIESEAVQLFLQRATVSQPDYQPDSQDLQSIVRICERLDGMPLAIELAAARLSLLSASEIADRLDSRFSLLTGGQRTALPRHQTLQAAIKWSYDLLSVPEQTLFRRLCIFAGSFALESVEVICTGPGLTQEEVLTLLGQLKDKSLLHVEPRQLGDSAGTRYRLLDTIGTFGLLKLEEANESRQLRNRHADYYMRLIESAKPELWLEKQPLWAKLLQLEYDNIRSAIDWSIDSDQAEFGLRIVAVMSWYWFAFHSMEESVELALKILALPSAAAPTIYRAKLLNTMSYQQCFLGETSTVIPQMEEALFILSNDEHERPLGLAWAYQLQAMVLSQEGYLEEAEEVMLKGLEIARAQNDHNSTSLAMTQGADIVLLRGDPQRAIRKYREAATFLRSYNKSFLAYVLRRLGYLFMELGELVEASHFFRESLELNRAVGDRRGIIANLLSLTALALRINQPAAAALFYGTVSRHMDSLGKLMTLDQAKLQLVRQQLSESLDEQTLSAAVLEGRAMTDERINRLIVSTFGNEFILVLAQNTTPDS